MEDVLNWGEPNSEEHFSKNASPSHLEIILFVPRINSPSVSQSVSTVMEKAPTRAFSWLKVPTRAITFKTLC